MGLVQTVLFKISTFLSHTTHLIFCAPDSREYEDFDSNLHGFETEDHLIVVVRQSTKIDIKRNLGLICLLCEPFVPFLGTLEEHVNPDQPPHNESLVSHKLKLCVLYNLLLATFLRSMSLINASQFWRHIGCASILS